MLTAPSLPAGTIAAFALTRPSREFNSETTGWVCPDGHTVKYPSHPKGTTVIFRE